jgi:hypothetical protein
MNEMMKDQRMFIVFVFVVDVFLILSRFNILALRDLDLIDLVLNQMNQMVHFQKSILSLFYYCFTSCLSKKKKILGFFFQIEPPMSEEESFRAAQSARFKKMVGSGRPAATCYNVNGVLFC